MKRLYLLDTKLELTFSSIQRSLKYLTTFCHSALGTLTRSEGGFVLSPKKAVTMTEMIANSRENPPSDCLRFNSLDFCC